ncbi:MAG: hypothetical protein HY093_04200 [Candidatus Liptonbacteria bacterium]|nr:hypothetical protein [Candidatus Liptonbacteria bacterium]
MNMVTSFLLLLAALITATGQILMKKGSQVLQKTLTLVAPDQLGGGWLKKIFTITFEPHVLIAFTLYFLGSFLWLKILTRGNLGSLYPILIGMTILITSVASVFIFKETFTIVKMAGVIFIILGVTLLLNFGIQHN